MGAPPSTMLQQDGLWSLWTLFPILVIFPGMFILALFTSNVPLLTRIAVKLAGPRIYTRFCDIQLSTLMLAFCIVCALPAYASIGKFEDRASDAVKDGGHSMLNFHLKHAFYETRNFYMSVLGALIWLVVGRFKTLVTSGALVRPQGGFRARSPVSRALFIALGLLCLAVADVPLCRIHYLSNLSSYVTPRKMDLLAGQTALHCKDVLDSQASGVCKTYCAEARELASVRYETTMWIRDWHFMGRIAAEVFDSGRGVDQGQDRINDLFKTRSCSRVLESVDKSNLMVNVMCLLSCALALVGGLSCLCLAFGEPPKSEAEQRQHQD